MATEKPPWSQQYQEVAALFHIGTTKSHPPIPEHLSAEAKDFLLKCLQKEPYLRPTASDLLKHPFVTGEHEGIHPVFRPSVMDNTRSRNAVSRVDLNKSIKFDPMRSSNGLKDACNMSNLRCSTVNSEKFSAWKSGNFDDDMCLLDDDDELEMVGSSTKFSTAFQDPNKSFNPMSEPDDNWSCKFDESPELNRQGTDLFSSQVIQDPMISTVGPSGEEDGGFAFPITQLAADDEDELTESKIRSFLHEKALDLKKLQTPLYEELKNSISPINLVGTSNKENVSDNASLPPKSKSPNRVPNRRLSTAVEVTNNSPRSRSKRFSSNGGLNYNESQSHFRDLKGLLFNAQLEPPNPSSIFSERQRKWKEELDEELKREREILRQAGVVKTNSPKADRVMHLQTDHPEHASPRK